MSRILNEVTILSSKQLSIGKAELRADGILTFEPDPATMKDYTVPILEEMLEVFLEMGDGEPKPYYCNNRYILGILGDEEKQFIDQNFHKFASHFGMTISSPVTRLVANAFFKVQKQPIPMKMFKEKEPAIEWLLSLKK